LPSPIGSNLRKVLVPDKTGHREPKLESAVETVCWLAESSESRHHGKLISAGWNNYKKMVSDKDIFTLKRLDDRNYSKSK